MVEYKLFLSDKPSKKYLIITPENKKVYFGQMGYGDYLIWNREKGADFADKKQKAYVARHSKMGEDWTKSGIDTPGWWARYLLWEKDKRTLDDAIKNIEDKFKIKISV